MSHVRADVKAIFLEALDCAGADQQARFLDQACAGDTVLRTRVEELLRAHRDAGGFLGGQQGADPQEPMTERAGTFIGPYKLMEQIGEGGMGLVFVAEQQHPVRRRVAIKVIKPGMDTREVIARFEAERQALALMDHANIAHVFDAGATESGRPYFVMELVRGVDITRFCDENRLSPRERLTLFIDVCRAVQHAHQKGIIHRDLKATNILVTLHDGLPVVKVIDFGVAKAIGQQLTDKSIYTRFTQMVGTPMYMSPEQAEMSGLDIDTRSDIYALGVLLYELLTGTTPFDNERLRTAAFDEMRRIIREEEPPRPSTRFTTAGQAAVTLSANRRSDPMRLSQLFRGELDWIVMKALEKDRNRRYDTASAFAADVQRYLNDEPVQACPPTFGYRVFKMVRRNRGAVLAGSLLLAALVLGIIGTTWGMLRATDAYATAVTEAKQKEDALKDKVAALAAAQRSEREANDQLFLALLSQARTGRFSRQMGQRLDSLTALEKAARIRPDDRLRDEAIAALALPDIRRGPSLHTTPSGTKRVTFDGSYRTYARISMDGAVSVRSIPDDKELHRFETKTKDPLNAVLSPNGDFLAVLDERQALQLWRVADGKPLLGESPGPCSDVAFSPDSRQVAIPEDDWVVVIDVASGQETRRWRLPAKVHALAFHPSNSRLAVGYAKSTVASIYDSAHGSRVGDLPIGLISLPVLAWHPDGTRLAVAGSDPRVQIWDVSAQHKLATLEGHVEQITALSFHPEGNLLASSSFDGVLRLWDPATGRNLMQLPLAAIPRFGKSGPWLGVAWQGGEHAQLLEAMPSHEYRTIVSSLGAAKGHYHDGDISPDGRLLAVGMDEGDRLWDLASRRELAVLASRGHCVLYQSERALLSCDPSGPQRWSIQEREGGAELRLGPPGKLSLPFVPRRVARSSDGRTLAFVSEATGAGLLVDASTDAVQLGPLMHLESGYVALSQDGRWLATSGWRSDRVRLWNAKTGTMAHEWVLGSIVNAFFTPDSRELIICRGDAFTFWDTETRKQTRRWDREIALYPGHVAFSPDGKLLALEMAPAVIHLKEVATGRIVAKLEDPHGDRAGWMSFTPDGTQLVAVAPYAKAIHVWNLRVIRARLKPMRLDWGWPEFMPADPKTEKAQLVKVEVLGSAATKKDAEKSKN